MIYPTRSLVIGLLTLATGLAATGLAATGPTATGPTATGLAAAEAEPEKYTLRYRFHPGETLRWEVVHRSIVDTTIAKTTRTVEALSKSIKAWRVRVVGPDGTASFEHLVESVDMRQKMTGQQEVRYNSLTDKQPPPGFKDVAESVGVPLAIIAMSNRGKILKREQKQVKAAAQSKGQMTIPLPDEPVPVGHTWSFSQDVPVKLSTGGIKSIRVRQTFKLQSVKTGVATIAVANQILTPIDDPKIESQLIQRESSGTVRFDVDAGRILSQQMDVDKQVVGFHTGASTIKYFTRFTERLLPTTTRTASRPADKRG